MVFDGLGSVLRSGFEAVKEEIDQKLVGAELSNEVFQKRVRFGAKLCRSFGTGLGAK